MNIAIIGYGRMGQEIEKIARERGHAIEMIIDLDNYSDLTKDALQKIDVAIEFTTPDSAIPNYYTCFEGQVPVVTGTTGWLDQYQEIEQKCHEYSCGFFYAPNFSLGVNVFFKLNQYLASIMDQLEDYEVDISETHHIYKKDAPSGTANKLAQDIIKQVKRKKNWVLNANESDADNINVKAYREDNVPGIHTIHYGSSVDDITITHSAKNRKGFALGAVLAAEYMKDKSGIHTMDDMLQI